MRLEIERPRRKRGLSEENETPGRYGVLNPAASQMGSNDMTYSKMILPQKNIVNQQIYKVLMCNPHEMSFVTLSAPPWNTAIPFQGKRRTGNDTKTL